MKTFTESSGGISHIERDCGGNAEALKPLPLVVRMTRAENSTLASAKLLEEARFQMREMRNLLHSQVLLDLFGECEDSPKSPHFAYVRAWLETRDELEAWVFGEENPEPKVEQATQP